MFYGGLTDKLLITDLFLTSSSVGIWDVWSFQKAGRNIPENQSNALWEERQSGEVMSE